MTLTLRDLKGSYVERRSQSVYKMDSDRFSLEGNFIIDLCKKQDYLGKL